MGKAIKTFFSDLADAMSLDDSVHRQQWRDIQQWSVKSAVSADMARVMGDLAELEKRHRNDSQDHIQQ